MAFSFDSVFGLQNMFLISMFFVFPRVSSYSNSTRIGPFIPGRISRDLLRRVLSKSRTPSYKWSICLLSNVSGFYCAKISRDLTEIDHLYDCVRVLDKTRLN